MLSRRNIPFQGVVKEELLAWKGYILFQRRQLKEAENVLEKSYLTATREGLVRGIDRPLWPAISSGAFMNCREIWRKHATITNRSAMPSPLLITARKPKIEPTSDLRH